MNSYWSPLFWLWVGLVVASIVRALFELATTGKTSPQILDNSTITILLACGLFFLAWYSLNEETSYTPEQINSVKQLLERKSSNLPQRQAKALMEVYNITEAEVAAPVLLWREK